MNKSLASIVFGIALAIAIARYVDLAGLLSVLQQTRIGWLLFAVVIFLVYQVLRALRFRLVLALRTPLSSIFNTLCLHTFFNNILPAGTGEIAFVWLFNRRHEVSVHGGVAGLVFARGIDLSLYGIAFLVLLVLFNQNMPGPVVDAIVWLTGLTTAAALGLIAWVRFTPHMRGDRLPRLVADNLAALRQAFDEVISRKEWLPILGFSVAMRVAIFLYFAAIVYALGCELPWFDVLWLYLLTLPVSALPIKSVANIGTHEAAWFISLQILGYDAHDAALYGFGSHVLFLLSSCVILAAPLGAHLRAKWARHRRDVPTNV